MHKHYGSSHAKKEKKKLSIITAWIEHTGYNPHRLQYTATIKEKIYSWSGSISLQRLAQLKFGPSFRTIAVYAVAPSSPSLWVHATQCLAPLVDADKDRPIL
jgi:hypothetical protein